MSIEDQVIGSAFAICAGMFFMGAVPWYVLRYVSRDGMGREQMPPLPRGRVPIKGFGLVDILGVSLFFAFYAF